MIGPGHKAGVQPGTSTGRTVPLFPEVWEQAGWRPLRWQGACAPFTRWLVRHRTDRTGNTHSTLWGLPAHPSPSYRLLLDALTTAAGSVPGNYVAPLRAACPDCDAPFAVLDDAERTLDDLLCETGTLSVSQALWIARQTVAGLLELRQAGRIHGDLKPAHIGIADDGRVRLTGLAFSAALPATCHAGIFLPEDDGYRAPESHLRDGGTLQHQDLYALGLIQFRMLTGRLPDAGSPFTAGERPACSPPPPLLRRWRPDAPREVAQLVSRLLAREPFRRPVNLHELLQELMRLELDALALSAA